MKLGRISKSGMDNLMDVVRTLKVAPEDILMYLLENPKISLEEAKRYGIEKKLEDFGG